MDAQGLGRTHPLTPTRRLKQHTHAYNPRLAAAAGAGSHGPGAHEWGRLAKRRPDGETARSQSAATRLASLDLRLAAWFLWMMPLEAALSSLRQAFFSPSSAAALSPASMASRTRRT